MVRGLVEEQKIGIPGESPGERGPGELASREACEWAVEVVGSEAEPARRCSRLIAPVVAASVLEPGLGLSVVAERIGVVRARGHGVLETFELRFDGQQLDSRRQDVFAQGEALVE